MIHISLHHSNNKKDRLTVVSICVSALDMCFHAWPQLLRMYVCETIFCIHGCLNFLSDILTIDIDIIDTDINIGIFDHAPLMFVCK